MNNNFKEGANPIKLYRVAKSGHSHRAELMMALLGLPYETIEVDMGAGEHQTSDYLKISPFGQVPVIDDNGTILSDSNGILIYLIARYAGDYEWLPSDPVQSAKVQRWLSIAAGEIAYGPCAARLVTVFGAPLDWENAKAIAAKLFAVMEAELAVNAFLTGDSITVADIAAYSYTAHAPEGGVSLDPYPNIQAWVKRIEDQPGFVGMAKSPIPA